MARKKKWKRLAAVPEPDPDPNSQLGNAKSHGRALCPPEIVDDGKCDFVNCASEERDSCAALVDADATPSKASSMVDPVKNDVPGSPVVALSGGQVLSLSPISTRRQGFLGPQLQRRLRSRLKQHQHDVVGVAYGPVLLGINGFR